MKITIITAVRNGEKEIARTLRSVASQTYAPIEHLVVDGASTDGTLDVVRSEGRHVSGIVSEPDSGVYDAFNKGLRLATGDVVAFLNAGDTYASVASVAQVVAPLQDPRVDAVFGDVSIVDPLKTDRVVRKYRSSRFAPQRMSFGFMPAHPALFIRRSVYDRCGEYDASYRIAGDFELCVRMFVREGIEYRYQPGVVVLMPCGGLSTSSWRANVQITREMYRACRSNSVRTSYARLVARFPLKFAELLGNDR